MDQNGLLVRYKTKLENCNLQHGLKQFNMNFLSKSLYKTNLESTYLTNININVKL